MTKPQEECLKQIEHLLLARLELIKLYPVLSAQAMQSLMENDAEGFLKKLDERGALIEKADAVTNSIGTLVSGLDGSFGAVIADVLKPGAQSNVCPEWCASAARIAERTQKLLSGCAVFDKKLLAHAKDMSVQMQENHGRTLMQQKINSLYTGQTAAAHGEHIHYSSK